MKKLFYYLGGIDDDNLKQDFLTSLPNPLGTEPSRLLQIKGKQINDEALGEIYQYVFLALDKLYNQ